MSLGYSSVNVGKSNPIMLEEVSWEGKGGEEPNDTIRVASSVERSGKSSQNNLGTSRVCVFSNPL